MDEFCMLNIVNKSTQIAPTYTSSRSAVEIVGMDLICDMPASTDGYKHILLTVC